MALVNPEVGRLVAHRLSKGGWSLTQMYHDCRRICSAVESMTVEQFKAQVVVPIINGQAPKDRDPQKKIDTGIPEAFQYRLARRMKRMVEEERNQHKPAPKKYECPKETCIGGSANRAGLARHIDTQHPEEAAELRQQVGFDPGAAAGKKQRDTLVVSEEKQQEILDMIKEELQSFRPEPDIKAPAKSEVRGLFLEFAREARDNPDPLQVAGLLESYTDLMWDLFVEEGKDE